MDVEAAVMGAAIAAGGRLSHFTTVTKKYGDAKNEIKQLQRRLAAAKGRAEIANRAVERYERRMEAAKNREADLINERDNCRISLLDDKHVAVSNTDEAKAILKLTRRYGLVTFLYSTSRDVTDFFRDREVAFQRLPVYSSSDDKLDGEGENGGENDGENNNN